jgi:hypothetical protein
MLRSPVPWSSSSPSLKRDQPVLTEYSRQPHSSTILPRSTGWVGPRAAGQPRANASRTKVRKLPMNEEAALPVPKPAGKVHQVRFSVRTQRDNLHAQTRRPPLGATGALCCPERPQGDLDSSEPQRTARHCTTSDLARAGGLASPGPEGKSPELLDRRSTCFGDTPRPIGELQRRGDEGAKTPPIADGTSEAAGTGCPVPPRPRGLGAGRRTFRRQATRRARARWPCTSRG